MQILVINLDRSPERLAHFTAEANRVGVQFDRISAVDGRELSEAEVQEQTDPAFEFKPLNRAEFGLFVSHRLAWQRLLESSEKNAAIFEDDVLLADNLAAVFSAIDALDQEFDVIKLETTFRSIVLNKEGLPLCEDTRLHPLLTWHGGTAGYVVSRRGAQRLLERKQRVSDPIDQVLFNPMSRVSQDLSVLQVVPAVCVQNDILARVHGRGSDFGSTIQQRRRWGQIFRYGPATDLRRLWTKVKERRRRKHLANVAGNQDVVVGYQGLKNESNTCQ